MSVVEDGGPAFPRDNQNGYQQEGMSLRDWLAGQALSMVRTSDMCAAAEEIAAAAYMVADAMLAARKGTQS